MTTPRIIRTAAELEALDPDAVTLDRDGRLDFAADWLERTGRAFPSAENYLPAVVIATGEPARAARKALLEELS